MHEPVGQLSVVGEQDQPDGVGIQTADIAHPLVAPNPFLDQLADAGAATVVRHGRQHAEGLVESQIHQIGVHDHTRTVNANHVDSRVDSSALLGDNLAVYLDATVVNHPFGNPA
ncbi:Uncharacterised protein [Mycobacteroides abscessus subsp. abscessus]|nr:Uncharacterised protein [Mycobacteroides abscessus subsp. abscessus]